MKTFRLALLTAVLLATSKMAIASCDGGSLEASPSGLFERIVVELQKDMDARKIKMTETAKAFMARTKTEAEFVNTIHADFDAYKASLNINREALARIVKTLSNFNGLKSLSPDDLTGLAETIVSQLTFDAALAPLFRAISLPTGDMGTTFMAGEYAGHLKGYQQSQRQKEDIETWLPRGLAGVKDIPDLNAKVRETRSQLQNAAQIPSDLVASIVTLAKKYQAHSRPLGMSLEQAATVREFQNLVNTHTFFKALQINDGDPIYYAWNRATTEGLVISLLSPLLQSGALRKTQMRLGALEWGIAFLQQNLDP